MGERYKKAIKDLLDAIGSEEHLKKIYTMTAYYADQESFGERGGGYRMKPRSEMIKEIVKALEPAGYGDVHSIYWFMVGFGLIAEEEPEEEHP